MIVDRRKLKKIILLIAIILFIVAGIFYTLKSRKVESIELLDIAKNDKNSQLIKICNDY